MAAAATAPRVNEIAAASTAIFFTVTDVGLDGWSLLAAADMVL